MIELLVAAAAFMPQDLPEPERQRRLAPLFSPRPGEMLTLDARELRELGGRIPAQKLRGMIQISPPPGVCLTVTRSADEPDERLCKPKQVAFALGQLNRAGRLVWTVRTGDDDFGTEISWPTPYRTGIVTPFDRAPQDPPDYKFVVRCSADRAARRIRIGLVSGETWIVALPKTDKLEPQPQPIPNLFMVVTGGKVSVADAAKQKEAAETAKKAEEAGAPAPTPAPTRHPDEAPDEDEDRAIWSIPARGAYGMSSSNFMPYGSVPPGGKGRCRYSYQGSAEDPATGRLECMDTDGFKHVLLPLTCLKDLKP